MGSFVCIIVIMFIAVLIPTAFPRHIRMKRVASFNTASDQPQLANYYQSLARMIYIHPKNKTVSHICSGFFVEMSHIDAKTATYKSTGYFVSVAHCFATLIQSLKTNAKQSITGKELNVIRDGNVVIYYGSTVKSKQKSLLVDLSKNPLRIPYSYKPPTVPYECPGIGDASILELSAEQKNMVVSGSGRFLQLTEIDSKIGIDGENCWYVGFGGKSDSANIGNVTFYTDDCLSKCNPADKQIWHSCLTPDYPVEESILIQMLIESGDSGAPVWCKRTDENGNEIWKVEGLMRSVRYDGNAVLLNSNRLRHLLLETFNDANF